MCLKAMTVNISVSYLCRVVAKIIINVQSFLNIDKNKENSKSGKILNIYCIS